MYVTAETINRIYHETVFRPNQRCGETLTVRGFFGTTHTFCAKRLNEKYMFILSALKGLPRSMRYSSSHTGKPWIMARGSESKYEGATLETAERLLVMAVALQMVRILNPVCEACDVPNVVIEDEKLRKLEMMYPKNVRRSSLINWK
jgi:hypothetical protein